MYHMIIAHPWGITAALLSIVLILFLKWWYPFHITYTYPPLLFTTNTALYVPKIPHIVLYVIRLTVVLLLALLIGMPRNIDPTSKIKVDGIGIALVLDVSESMFQYRLAHDGRTRFKVAQDEAIRFIHKRKDDAIALVLFGQEILSRCPLTYDKLLVAQCIKEYRMRDIDGSFTRLSSGLLAAINRLKNWSGQSRVIVLITDGAQTQGDVSPEVAIEAAKKYNIKIYTIGIGGNDMEEHNNWFMLPFPGSTINHELLEIIARETGGVSYVAKTGGDMRAIYDSIDALERVNYDAPIYTRYKEFAQPCSVLALLLLCIELLLRCFVWWGL